MGQVTQLGQVDSLHLKQAEKLNHTSSLPLFHNSNYYSWPAVPEVTQVQHTVFMQNRIETLDISC